MDVSALVSWVERQAADRAASQLPVAYVTLCPKEGAAYPQRARVELTDVDDIGRALRDACEDIARAADAEDRAVSRVRVRLYAAKGAAELSSTTFRVASTDDEPATTGTPSGELAACLREMRLAVGSLVESNRQMAQGAFGVGIGAINALQTLGEQNAQLTGALVIAENENKGTLSQLQPLLDAVAPAMPLLLAKLTGTPAE